MRSYRGVISLTIAVVVTCLIMVAATLLAQASHASESGRWTTPRDVSQSGNTYSIAPDLVVDSQDDVHLIWMTGTTSSASKDLYYARSSDSGSTWSAKHHISTVEDSSDGSIAVGSDGTAHVTWWGKEVAVFRLYYASGIGAAWGPPTHILETSGKISSPAIVVANGTVHIVFSYKPGPPAPDIYYTKYVTETGGWLPETIVTDTVQDSFSPAVAADQLGNLHVVWEERGDPWEILYVSGTVGVPTTWSSIVTVSAGIETNATQPDIAVGSDDVAHVVFGKTETGTEHSVYYAAFPISDPAAMSPREIPGSLVDISKQLPSYPTPSVAIDDAGRVHVVWNGVKSGDSSDRIYYAMSEDQGDYWSDPLAVSTNDSFPEGFAVIASDGTSLYVAWQQEEDPDDDQDIYIARHFPVAVFVPLGLKNYP